MATTRSQVAVALLAQLEAQGYFSTYSRRWRSAWDDPAGQLTAMPLLVARKVTESFLYPAERGLPPIRVWEYQILVYDKIPANAFLQDVPDPTQATGPGDIVLDNMIQAVEEALAPDGPDGVLTLGGLVIDCRIEGVIIEANGDEDPSGLCGANIPVRVLIP